MTCNFPPCPPPQRYNSLRFVDNVESNLLFRGGEPLNDDGTFDYAGLTAAIRNAALPPSVAPPIGSPFYNDPPDYFLVDINLLHPDETGKISAGIDYFQQHPTQGRIHLWDTNGTPECVFSTAPAERAHRVRTLGEWLPDPLIWRVAQIRKMLEPSPVPRRVVVYAHCDGGCDRTGEMIGAYRLRYMQDTWAQVMEDQPCGNPLGCDNYRALQWYAFWLNEVMGFSLHGIGEDCGCLDAGGVHRPCMPR